MSTLKVDTAQLAKSGQSFQSASDAVPQAPSPYIPPGSDALSAAAAAQAPKFAEPVSTGLPQLKTNTGTYASNVSGAASTYSQTDQQHAQDIRSNKVPDPSASSGGGGGAPGAPAAGGGGAGASAPGSPAAAAAAAANGSPASAGAAAAGAGGGAGGGMDQLGQMMQMPMQMAGQMAQIPMQLGQMAGSLPQTVMQAAQQAAQQASQMAGKNGKDKTGDADKKPEDNKPDEAKDKKDPKDKEPKAGPEKEHAAPPTAGKHAATGPSQVPPPSHSTSTPPVAPVGPRHAAPTRSTLEENL